MPVTIAEAGRLRQSVVHGIRTRAGIDGELNFQTINKIAKKNQSYEYLSIDKLNGQILENTDGQQDTVVGSWTNFKFGGK